MPTVKEIIFGSRINIRDNNVDQDNGLQRK